MREAAWMQHRGVCWRDYTPSCQKRICLSKGTLEALEHPVQPPLPQPPPHRVTLWTDASGGNWGGLGEGGGLLGRI